jgi:8-amino-7-oxononanoate synthase
VAAVRPPSVPAGGSRLRISLMATHGREAVEGLIGALEEILGGGGGGR